MKSQLGHGATFVNRKQQLDLLAERCRAAAAGEGAIVLLAGEAGTGKSRLVLEFCRTLPSGTRYAVGQCLEYAQVPFGPVLSILESLIREDPAALRASGSIRATLARLLPDVEELSVGAAALDSDKLRQFNAMAEALQRFAADHVTVVVLEDLHWADSATLELLQHLVAYVAKSKLLVIGTYRRDELRRGHPLRSTLAKLERTAVARRSSLHPLSADEMHQLVFYALESKNRPTAELVDAIITQAEGNPLFAEELLKTVMEGGTDHGARSVPATVREAVLERLAAFDEEERDVLVCAAAIGRRFDADFLAAIAEQHVDAILPVLKRAIDLDLIVEEGDHKDAILYSFRHALTREAIYRELLASEARRLHSKIALALQSAGGSDRTVELAYHYWCAHDNEKSADYNERAGDAACVVFAYRDGAVHYDRALTSAAVSGVRAARLQGKLADASFQGGYLERAQRAAEAALQFYESTGDSENAAEACVKLARFAGSRGDSTTHLHFARRALELAAGNRSSPAYFSAHIEMARSYTTYWLDTAKAQEHLVELECLIGSTKDEIRFLELQMTLQTVSGKPEAALEASRKAADIALRAGDAQGAARSWGNFATAMSETGQREPAREAFARALEIVRTNRIAGLTADWIHLTLASSHMLCGETAKARELVEQLLAAHVESLGFRISLTRVGIPIGLWLENDDLVRRCAADSLVDQALASGSGQLIGALACYIELRLVQGRDDEARSILRRAYEALVAADAHLLPGDADWLFLDAARFGTEADVTVARGMLERIAHATSVPSVPAYRALFDAFESQRHERRDEMVARSREAAGAFEAIGWPYHVAQALEVSGELAKARERYQQIGDVRDARRIDAALNPVNRRGRTKGELTAREREICDLLVQGKTNKAIAEKLVLSERTVESHVSSVLTKMSAASRAELIAKLKS